MPLKPSYPSNYDPRLGTGPSAERSEVQTDPGVSRGEGVDVEGKRIGDGGISPRSAEKHSKPTICSWKFPQEIHVGRQALPREGSEGSDDFDRHDFNLVMMLSRTPADHLLLTLIAVSDPLSIQFNL